MRPAYTFWLALIVFTTGMASFATQPNTTKVMEELRKGDYSDAVPALQEFTKESPDYLWSLQELAKSYYKLERWTEFFGIAYFSRKALPVTNESEKIRLLEVLGLLRHCQTDQAKQVLLIRPAPTDSPLKKHFDVLAELLQVSASVSKNTESKDRTKKASGMFPSANLWPVANLSMQKLDPHRLRRKVVGKCEKAKP